MNEKEINGAFDREYEKYKNSPEYKEGFIKIKMPTYYIAKHSDEDLRAAVLAEREACIKLLEDFSKTGMVPVKDTWRMGLIAGANAIRARGDEIKDGIALASIAHPEGDPVPDDHEINPDSLETMEIYIPINERIKELARQAGFNDFPDDKNGVWITDGYWNEELERFAELVSEQTHTNNKAQWYQEGYEAGQRDEREACAKLCESMGVHPALNVWGGGPEWYKRQKECAAAIRGRTQ
jgi:hypothetical protein